MTDPLITTLVGALPVMRDGKPRRFSRFCECFEWTFNRVYRHHHSPSPSMIEVQMAHVDLVAGALFHHQRDNPGLFSKPKIKAGSIAA